MYFYAAERSAAARISPKLAILTSSKLAIHWIVWATGGVRLAGSARRWAGQAFSLADSAMGLWARDAFFSCEDHTLVLEWRPVHNIRSWYHLQSERAFVLALVGSTQSSYLASL